MRNEQIRRDITACNKLQEPRLLKNMCIGGFEALGLQLSTIWLSTQGQIISLLSFIFPFCSKLCCISVSASFTMS